MRAAARELFGPVRRVVTPTGADVTDGDEGELLMLGPGEAFLWPAADANFSSVVIAEAVSVRPRVFHVRGVMTSAEVDALLLDAEPKLRQSGETHYGNAP